MYFIHKSVLLKYTHAEVAGNNNKNSDDVSHLLSVVQTEVVKKEGAGKGVDRREDRIMRGVRNVKVQGLSVFLQG